MQVIPCRSLAQLAGHLARITPIPARAGKAPSGGHNMFMSGPPGSGKTLLARAMPGILPRMTGGERLGVGSATTSQNPSCQTRQIRNR